MFDLLELDSQCDVAGTLAGTCMRLGGEMWQPSWDRGGPLERGR